MKKIWCCILACCLISGCFSYKDTNQMVFITMSVFDMQRKGPALYGEAFKAYRGEGEKAGKEKRTVLYGRGKSVTEAAATLRNSANNPIEYAGSKAMVFCKDFAQWGVKTCLDIYQRDQKPSLRQYLFVFDGKADEFLQTSMETEQFTGLYLYSLINSQKHTIDVIESQYYQFVDNITIGSGINVVPIISLWKVGAGSGPEQAIAKTTQQWDNGDQGEQHGQKSAFSEHYLQVNGAAVFVKDVMCAQLDPMELETYKLMKIPTKSGLLTTPDPQNPDSRLGYSVLKSKPSHQVSWENDRLKVQYKTTVRVVLVEAQQGIEKYDLDYVQQAKKELSRCLEIRMLQLFEEMRGQGIDILDVKRSVDLKYPGNKLETPLSAIDFEPIVEVILDGTGPLKENFF